MYFIKEKKKKKRGRGGGGGFEISRYNCYGILKVKEKGRLLQYHPNSINNIATTSFQREICSISN